MRYKNAYDILPEELVKEVQKYASGETIYFPKETGKRKWGELSGARIFFQQRNEEIRQKYLSKTSIEKLAEDYCLSTETVRKIVFQKD